MLLQPIADTAYRFGHRALALGLALGVRVWHQKMGPGLQEHSPELLAELGGRFGRLLDEDLANVKAGYYPRKLLWDLAVLKRYLVRKPIGFMEMPRILRRAKLGNFDDIPAEIDRSAFPSYYLRTFHWQSDGWLSDHSAEMYDIGVEFLFMGVADVMRRMAIPPIVDANSGNPRPRVLDLACGTGRFLDQLGQALPAAELTGVDLSPFYLSKAQRDGCGGGRATFVEANAEALPFPDASFDAVTSVFLFHELPKDARRRVMAEALRVLTPGGRFVVLDSGQNAGNEAFAEVFANFPRLYHEPYYKGYLADDLTCALAEVGFDVKKSLNHLFSRLVVAEKA